MGKLQAKHPGGRPTTYDPAYCDEADVYLAECQDTYDEFHKTRGDKTDTYERIPVVKLPTYEGFCQHINTPYETIMDWREVHPEFKAALNRIKLAQKKRLIEGGVAGTYNPTIAKLILSANHGMNETSESTLHIRIPKPILDVNDPANVLPDDSNKENPALT